MVNNGNTGITITSSDRFLVSFLRNIAWVSISITMLFSMIFTGSVLGGFILWLFIYGIFTVILLLLHIGNNEKVYMNSGIMTFISYLNWRYARVFIKSTEFTGGDKDKAESLKEVINLICKDNNDVLVDPANNRMTLSSNHTRVEVEIPTIWNSSMFDPGYMNNLTVKVLSINDKTYENLGVNDVQSVIFISLIYRRAIRYLKNIDKTRRETVLNPINKLNIPSFDNDPVDSSNKDMLIQLLSNNYRYVDDETTDALYKPTYRGTCILIEGTKISLFNQNEITKFPDVDKIDKVYITGIDEDNRKMVEMAYSLNDLRNFEMMLSNKKGIRLENRWYGSK